MTLARALGCALVAQIAVFAALASCGAPKVLTTGAKGPCGDDDPLCEVCPNGDRCHPSYGGRCDEVTGSCGEAPPPVLFPIGGAARALDAGRR